MTYLTDLQRTQAFIRKHLLLQNGNVPEWPDRAGKHRISFAGLGQVVGAHDLWAVGQASAEAGYRIKDGKVNLSPFIWNQRREMHLSQRKAAERAPRYLALAQAWHLAFGGTPTKVRDALKVRDVREHLEVLIGQEYPSPTLVGRALAKNEFTYRNRRLRITARGPSRWQAVATTDAERFAHIA
jgi:hypothetical protein